MVFSPEPSSSGILGHNVHLVIDRSWSLLVFFFKSMNRQLFDGMLGFTGGVMIAASYWSLLAPAIEISSQTNPNVPEWFPAAVGFLMGALFLLPWISSCRICTSIFPLRKRKVWRPT